MNVKYHLYAMHSGWKGSKNIPIQVFQTKAYYTSASPNPTMTVSKCPVMQFSIHKLKKSFTHAFLVSNGISAAYLVHVDFLLDLKKKLRRGSLKEQV